MKKDRERERLVKLQKARELLNSYMLEMDDPNMRKDVSENSPLDELRAKIKNQEKIVMKLEQGIDIIDIPGTWNIDDVLYVKFIRIFSYGKDKDVPKDRVKIKLVDSFDITTLEENEELNIEKLGDGSIESKGMVMPTDISSPLGAALLHKAHTSVRYNTPVGYCEVEVERCLF